MWLCKVLNSEDIILDKFLVQADEDAPVNSDPKEWKAFLDRIRLKLVASSEFEADKYPADLTIDIDVVEFFDGVCLL